MARRASLAVVPAVLWLLLLALAHQGEATRLLTEDITARAEGARVVTEVDNRPVDFSGSDCGPLGQHKYRCVPPMKNTVSPIIFDSSVEDNRPLDFTRSDCGPLGKHKYRCVPPMKTPASEEFDYIDSSVEDNRPVDFTPGSDCGPLGKHKYRCVPPMKTIDEAAPVLVDSSVEDNRPLDYTGSDCGPLGKHKYRCVPPMKTTPSTEDAPVSVEDNPYSPWDCLLGKHKLRCGGPP